MWKSSHFLIYFTTRDAFCQAEKMLFCYIIVVFCNYIFTNRQNYNIIQTVIYSGVFRYGKECKFT